MLSAQAPQLAATMRRYLVQLTTFLAPRSVDVADSTLRQLARWLVAETERGDGVRHHPHPRRGLQGVAGRPAWLQGSDPGQEHPTPAAADDPDLLRAPHRMGLARSPPAEPASSTGTSHPGPSRCPSSSPTRTRPSCWLQPRPTVCPAIGWWSRCCPGPACGRPSSANWPPTPSSCATGPTGCASPSASCATTGSSRSIPNWWCCWATLA